MSRRDLLGDLVPEFWIGGAQNLPISVCTAVRVVLLADPRLCTSLIAAA